MAWWDACAHPGGDPLSALSYTLGSLQACDVVVAKLQAALGAGSADIAAVQAEAPFQGALASTLPTFKATAISLWHDPDLDAITPQQYPAIWVTPSDQAMGTRVLTLGEHRGDLAITLRLWVASRGYASTKQAPTIVPQTTRVCLGLLGAMRAVIERDVVGSAGIYSALVVSQRPATPPQAPPGVYYQAWDQQIIISGRARQSRGM